MNEITRQEIIRNSKKKQQTSSLNNNELDNLVKMLNGFITNPQYSNNRKTVNRNDVKFFDFLVGDKEKVTRVESIENGIQTVDLTISSTKKLSKILFDIYYPKPTENKFYHYTKISAFKHIIKGNLRLKPLIKNENYDEFVTFYKDHNLKGYFQNNKNSEPMSETLMKEIYTLCMASKVNLSEKNESVLWNSFGDNGNGIRLELEIKSKHPDFRKIFYRDHDFSTGELLINKINEKCTELYDRRLFVSGVSKIGAFYLPGEYKIENEVRFAIKKHTDEYSFDFDDSKNYIDLPFKSKYAQFKVTEIFVGLNCNEDMINEIINLVEENGYSKEIVKYKNFC